MKYKLIKIKDIVGTTFFAVRSLNGFETEFYEKVSSLFRNGKVSRDAVPGKLYPSDEIIYEVEFNKFDDLLELIPEEFL